jgi:hypothetical protein
METLSTAEVPRFEKIFVFREFIVKAVHAVV